MTGQVLLRRLVPSSESVLAWLRELPAPVAVAYEAGPTGFDLARQGLDGMQRLLRKADWDVEGPVMICGIWWCNTSAMRMVCWSSTRPAS